MSNKPWEGRTVYCSGAKVGGNAGWIEVQEEDIDRIRIIPRPNSSVDRNLVMTRAEAKTFAAQMMNLANRIRP